jgi:DNA-binding transcriptional LysR family regulator
MPGLTLLDIQVLAEIAAHGSFRAAALRLDIPPSTISRRVAAVEQRLGVRLFNRTTRSVAPTAAGAALLGRTVPAMHEIEGAIAEVGSSRAEPGGPLRINGSAAALRLLMPIVARFLADFPKVEIDLVEDGHLSDIVRLGFDAGVRLAEDVPRDMVAIPVGPDQRLIVVGSPGYLAGSPAPKRPADLLRHRCIRARMPSGRLIPWEFSRHGEAVTIAVSGPLVASSNDLALSAAEHGLGLAYVTETAARPGLASGSLIEVLSAWTPAFPGLRLYYPQHRIASVTLRSFTQMLRRFRTDNPQRTS